MSVVEEIEKDFPHLPLGCHITLEKVAKEYVLENIKASINSFRKNKVLYWINTYNNDTTKSLTLTNFLQLHQIPLERFYKTFTWNSLLLEAGKCTKKSRFENELKRAVYKKWLATDSFTYFSFIEIVMGESVVRIKDECMKMTMVSPFLNNNITYCPGIRK